MANIPLRPFVRRSNVRILWIPEIGRGLRARYEQLLARLNVLRRARAEGVENRPHRDDVALDTPQQEILNEVEQGSNLLRQWLDGQLSDANDEIAARTPALIDGDAIVMESETVVRGAHADFTFRLTELWKAQERPLRLLKAFKLEHRLATRDAAYSEDPYKPWIWLALIQVLEAIFNGGAFRMAGGGWINGVLLATAFAAANIAVGLATGFLGLRSLWHRRAAVKAAGWLGTPLLLAAGALVNLLAANWRDALEADLSTREAVSMMVKFRPLSELSYQSMFLLIMGGVFFLIAVWKGVGGKTMPWDTYHQFAERTRAWRQPHQDYADAKADCSEVIQAGVLEDLARVRRQIEADALRVREAAEVADEATLRCTEAVQSLIEWQDMGHTLLTAYRDENRRVRDPGSEPAYFADFPDLRALSQGAPDGSEQARASARAVENHTRNCETAREVERRLNELLTAELANFADLIATIEAQARRELDEEQA